MGFFDQFFGKPTPDKFAKVMIKALRRAGDHRTSVYDKAGFRLLHTEDGKEAGVMHLSNLFKEYCKLSGKERSAWLSRTCVGLLNRMELPEDFEDVAPDILPTVRPRSMFELMDLDAEIEGKKPMNVPSLPLTDHLVACLVYDLPNSMRFVTQDNLDEWNVTLYEAAEVARRNLEERPFQMLSLDKKLYVVESGDAYDGTRILMTEMIRNLELTGHPVVMPVTRDTLLITGSEDDHGLNLMLALAEQKENEARPLCSMAILLSGDEWQTWLPSPEHSLFVKFKELECKYLARDYAEQKELLEKQHEQSEEDVFVASYSPVERDGQVTSYCVWSKSVPTWLPRADYVALFDPELNTHRFVTWERLQETVGGMMQSLDNYPPRWFVCDFPSEDQIATMQPADWS